ncbi:putative membrane protein YhhN [Pedobacter sp. UYP24]
MLKKYLKFNILILLIVISYTYGALLHIDLVKLITKPLFIVSLLTLFVYETKLKGRFHKRIFIGLSFALLGDILLLFVYHTPAYFTYGLFAFLLCHIFYIAAFYLDFRSAPELDKKTARIALFICALVCTTAFFYLRPHLGTMRIPVLLFTLVVGFMVLMATFRNLRVNSRSFNLILAGAILFLLFDAITAYNHFIVNSNAIVTYTTLIYFLAQYLIVFGGIDRKLIVVD